MLTNYIYLVYIYQQYLALNNLQGLIRHKNQLQDCASVVLSVLCATFVSQTETDPYSTMANMLDYNIIVSEFELQSHYYIHF